MEGQWTHALKSRFGFHTPHDFRLLEERNLFFLSEAARHSDCTAPGDHYLWISDMEWYQPEGLLQFELADYHLPAFVPFAFTGGGDYWCWATDHQHGETAPVASCPHDCELAELFAPSFSAALFRQVIEYCQCGRDDDPDTFDAMISRYIVDLSGFWPEDWRNALRDAATSAKAGEFIKSQSDSMVQSLSGFDSLDLEIPWMKQSG